MSEWRAGDFEDGSVERDFGDVLVRIFRWGPCEWGWTVYDSGRRVARSEHWHDSREEAALDWLAWLKRPLIEARVEVAA